MNANRPSKYARTSYTLLQQAHDTSDQVAWSRFVDIYRKFILYVLRELGVSEGDLDDLTQQVLIGLSTNLSKYDRSKSSFRTWLSSVIRNAAIDHFRKMQCRPAGADAVDDSSLVNGMHSPAEIDEWVEKEWATYISSQAMDRVRKAFRGQAIEVFEMGLDGASVEEIAKSTGLSVSSVYTLKKRVKKRLFVEVRALKGELEL